MKVNELRIGNLIDDGNGNIHTVDIDSLKNMDVNGWGEPIPLTEEWLLNFGFGNYEKFRFYKNLLAIDDTKIDGWVVCQFDEVDGQGHLLQNLKLQYVHELQNLYFALTGQELKLKE